MLTENLLAFSEEDRQYRSFRSSDMLCSCCCDCPGHKNMHYWISQPS